MKLIQTLRDQGVALRLLDDGRLGVKNSSALTDEQIALLSKHKDEVIATLRKGHDDIGDMIICCQAAADIYPDEAKAIGTLLRQWQGGEVTDREGTFLRVKAFFDKCQGRPVLEGEALAKVMEEVFPGRYGKREEPPRDAAAKPLDLSAFAPAELDRLELAL